MCIRTIWTLSSPLPKNFNLKVWWESLAMTRQFKHRPRYISKKKKAKSRTTSKPSQSQEAKRNELLHWQVTFLKISLSLTRNVSQWWKRLQKRVPMVFHCIDVNAVERKRSLVIWRTTLRQTIWRESPSLAIFVRKHSGPDKLWKSTWIRTTRNRIIIDNVLFLFILWYNWNKKVYLGKSMTKNLALERVGVPMACYLLSSLSSISSSSTSLSIKSTSSSLFLSTLAYTSSTDCFVSGFGGAGWVCVCVVTLKGKTLQELQMLPIRK